MVVIYGSEGIDRVLVDMNIVDHMITGFTASESKSILLIENHISCQLNTALVV